MASVTAVGREMLSEVCNTIVQAPGTFSMFAFHSWDGRCHCLAGHLELLAMDRRCVLPTELTQYGDTAGIADHLVTGDHNANLALWYVHRWPEHFAQKYMRGESPLERAELAVRIVEEALLAIEKEVAWGDEPQPMERWRRWFDD